jgi:hypothetical protein
MKRAKWGNRAGLRYLSPNGRGRASEEHRLKPSPPLSPATSAAPADRHFLVRAYRAEGKARESEGKGSESQVLTLYSAKAQSSQLSFRETRRAFGSYLGIPELRMLLQPS